MSWFRETLDKAIKGIKAARTLAVAKKYDEANEKYGEVVENLKDHVDEAKELIEEDLPIVRLLKDYSYRLDEAARQMEEKEHDFASDKNWWVIAEEEIVEAEKIAQEIEKEIIKLFGKEHKLLK